MTSFSRPQGWLRACARVTVLATIIAGCSALAVLQKSITVDVDGRIETVTAYGATVGDVLAMAEIHPESDALVEPDVAAAAQDGGTIIVRSSHQVQVEIDGEMRTVTTTALTVGELLASLGPRGEGATANVSRSTVLRDVPVRVSTLKSIHVVVDGALIPVSSAELTVGQVLDSIELTLNPGDRVSSPLSSAAADGMLLVVSRAATSSTQLDEVLPFVVEEKPDPNLPKDMRVVKTKGKLGAATTTYRIETVGGIEVRRVVESRVVTKEPQSEVVLVGTMEVNSTPVDPGTARAIGKSLAAERGWGDDQFACLDRLWQKESKWNVAAENRHSGAYGIPQAVPGSKMASAGADWRTNPATQIMWGLGYIEGRYGTPCGAWAHSVATGWY